MWFISNSNEPKELTIIRTKHRTIKYSRQKWPVSADIGVLVIVSKGDRLQWLRSWCGGHVQVVFIGKGFESSESWRNGFGDGKENRKRKEGKRGQEGFYNNIVAHSSFRSSSLSSESIMLGQDPCNLCCLFIILSQLLQENPLRGSTCCGAECGTPTTKPSSAPSERLASRMDP